MAMRDRKVVPGLCVCLVIMMLLVPYVSATVDSTTIPKSMDPNAEDRPEVIATLKTHVAYVGEVQDARMNGVIMYVDNISDGAGITGLQQIQDDYLLIASSIPLMHSYAEIAQARDDLRIQTQLFSDETKAQMAMFGGNDTDMRACISSSTDAVDNAISALTGPLWLSNESSRITVFNQDSDRRLLLIRSLDRMGIDTTLARNISDQIDAQRSGIQDALGNRSAAALVSTNTAIKALSRQFRENIESSRAAFAIETKGNAMTAMK
jgi:hypothetical protein